MLTNIRLISVREYHKMAETGIFHPEERLELIAGQIIRMSAKGTAHESAITRTERLLRQRLGDKVLLRIQSPVQLDDYSEPEPDISVVKLNPLDYEDHHPNASEVFLLIEIADSSLKYDREVKAMASPTPRANAYSKSGIIEYWILDVNGRKLYMYRLPSPDGYHSESILAEDVTISPLAFPDCAIAIRELLRKI
ncbi:Uma2 family endonuclease [Nostoc flagelliforme FACHB-838]|uniref:Uma2 family endonuclease n=1 Tax=Nostoc flagelliforme FACHB-838 TaxID=2692904 RepID=A0ABR8DIV4_9NOSO|nr:Uma2 family endonuclease [Nostoc flagelliforme]MBD2529223.1 Uma2 family endonuclease [Nostoc flagelliforme FACHB-838]